MKIKTVVLALFAAFSGVVYAQDSLLGKYSGSVDRGQTRNLLIGITVVISSVDGGVVKGTGARSGGPCVGEYPLEGTYKDNALVLRTTKKGGAGGDCDFFFTGVVEGNNLVGKLGPTEVRLRK